MLRTFLSSGFLLLGASSLSLPPCFSNYSNNNNKITGKSLLKFPFRHASATRERIRNIAVIAHVDHGKTTLVDAMLSQSGTVKDAHNRVMDSKDQERERGITILAKNTAIVLSPKICNMEGKLREEGERRFLNGNNNDNNNTIEKNNECRINIVDTPGHLDFSGEVERALQMVEGFVLLVDAWEGVKPGTRYVLRKALSLGLRPIVCINKIDKDDSAIEKTVEQVQDLFLDICEESDQLDHLFFMYGSGRDGYMNDTPVKSGTLQPLFEKVFEKIPPPKEDDQEKLQFLVAQVDENEKSALKVLIGRVFKGTVAVDDTVTVVLDDRQVDALVKSIELFEGINKIPVKEASFGDVCALYVKEPVGKKIPLHIGATVCAKDSISVYPYKKPDDPTYILQVKKMEASWKGKEAADNMSMFPIVQKRLEREAMVNTALHLDGLGTGLITMQGRGPLHLSVIIEDLRREGYEFEIMSPGVILKTINGIINEPFERVQLEHKEILSSEVISMLAQKMAELGDIHPIPGDRVIMECVMPVRFMTNLTLLYHKITGGDGVLNHSFEGYRPQVGTVSSRTTGALISVDNGRVESYSLMQHQETGRFFVMPGDQIYYGQIVGENTKTLMQNLGVNICKKNEQQAGLRANATDKAKKKTPNYSCRRFNFEDCIGWVMDDELITVTPKSIRMRKPGFNGKTSMRSIGQ